ncbi:rab-GTPase-TBC domain-containing protein [Elsinoe ampelina]|uniref:Rab-GTPase-TBC domain-containing protein n=1 Tax=Elsinoe ampelina TaxID=302913 RepID=A0A6A6G7N4_9PEZI|nr:rab-GTPase-TBC domain-containing protein [Elsinoe ampelina]
MHSGLQRSGASIPGSTAQSFLSVQGVSRRKTWAPGRKTVKQLEDEYHDSDEDVPEDAVIWNVPISPLEPFTTASRDPSPRRMSSLSSLSSNGQTYKHPSAPNTAVMAPHPNPHLGLPRSATTGSFPNEPFTDMFSLRERHRSWQNDLSSEAKQISLALEVHANKPSIDSKLNTPAGSPPNSALSRRQSNVSSLSLPPIQKSNVMIDPLPISKEKEAVLARTRPSWLPPKNKKEERKHLKEWERMMAHSAIADRRRAAKQLEELESSRQTKDNVERIWEDHVLPNWDAVMNEPRTRELWWRGVNPKIRGEVWKRAIGNGLQLSSTSYSKALERSSSLDEDVVKQISVDAAAAFPETGLFKEETPMHTSLVDVLKAYAAYRPYTGYQSCMTRPAAVLLLNMEPSDAFIALANTLNRSLPNAFLTNDRQGIDKWTGIVWSTLKYKYPKLHDHLIQKAQEVYGEELVRPMLESLFTRHLDLETTSRLWDVYVFEGDKLLVRAFTGVLGLLESGLYGTKEEILAVLGQRAAVLEVGTSGEVMKAVREAGKVDRR